jgi:D-glycero-alpha-D-manno-heptose-7-phosphate kinase
MVISKTPLRISFVGGGTDLASYYRQQEGKVISTAINKYIYVIVKKRIDDLIVLHYTKNEIVESVDLIQHEIIKECMKMVGLEKGVEIITLSDITTQGSGLGSSSVLTVGLLNALYAYKGVSLNNDQLAEKACIIEIDHLKKPIGKQDQYIASFGGMQKFIFHTNDKVTVQKIDLPPAKKGQLKKNVFIYNTNITRKADSILSVQNASAAQNEKSLNIIGALVEKLEQRFAEGDIDSLGAILNENWELKKKLANGISNGDIDVMVDAALAGGATGCKIAGAGGGGYLICYVPVNDQITFLKGMEAYNLVDFDFDDQGSKIVFNLM